MEKQIEITTISKSIIYRGRDRDECCLVRNRQQWQLLGLGNLPVGFDFRKQMIVAAFMVKRSYGADLIEITSAKLANDGTLIVSVKENRPRPSCFYAEALFTRSVFHVIAVPRKGIRELKVDKISDISAML